MDYIKAYVNLMFKVKQEQRSLNSVVYYEKHHMLPKSLFPEFKDFKSNGWNMVLLTTREHFVAHRLLAKFFGIKMVYAIQRMCNAKNSKNIYQITSRTYDYLINLRNIAAKNDIITNSKKGRPGKNQNPEHVKNRNLSRMKNGSWFSDPKSTGEKIKKALAGKPMLNRRGISIPKESIQKMIQTRRDNGSFERSVESKQKQSDTLKQKYLAGELIPNRMGEEAKAKMVLKMRDQVSCPHCQKTGGRNAMTRWHFNNCKHISG